MEAIKKLDSNKKIGQKLAIKVLTILVLVLFVNLPVVSALEISNVRVESLSETTAEIKWATDEPADSFLNYGTDQEKLATLGDASQVTEHKISLSNLIFSKNLFKSANSG